MPGTWTGGHSSRGDITKICTQGKSTKGGKWSSSQPCMPRGSTLWLRGEGLSLHTLRRECWTGHGRLLCSWRPVPTFTRLLPHGLGALRTPRTNQQVFRAPHTVKLQRQALKGCTACRFKESHLSALMQPALVLFTLSSCAGTDPCHPGRRALLSLLEAISSAFQPLGPGSSEAEGCPPPPCPASLLAIPSAAPRGPPSSPAAEPAEGASDHQPAVPARLGSLLPHLCARRGALCSPRACLPSLVPNDNKVGLG